MKPEETAAWIIFTDLDGTLLDLQTYSFDQAKSAVELLHARHIPLVFCSSKTRTEQEFYQRQLKVNTPFIVENGSAIFVPSGYFNFIYPYHKSLLNYHIIELGTPVAQIRQAIAEIKANLKLTCSGYADLSLAEIGRLTGLDEAAARRASQREYSETILTADFSPETLKQFQNALAQKGLASVAGSRFYTITDQGCDKGQAVLLLTELFRRKFGSIVTVGLGDSLNDLSLLGAVNWPFLVQQPGGRWAELNLPRLEKVAGIGLAGWQKVIFDYQKSWSTWGRATIMASHVIKR